MIPSAARLAPAFLVLTLTACDSDSSGIALPELLVHTDKTVYSKAVDGPVNTFLVNQSSTPLYVLMGDYVYIEQASDNGWLYHGPWFFVDGFGPSFTLEPGDTLLPFPMDLDYIGRAGAYRFVYQVSLDPLMRQLLPKEERVSEPFRVDW